MKKLLSILICFSIIFCSLCVSSYAADTLRYSIDAKPEGTYVQGGDSPKIMGWAFDTKSKTVRGYYKIDNGSEKSVDPVNRTDVQAAYPGQCSQLDCGFNQQISVDTLSYGTHTFKFYVKYGTTTKTLCETSFKVIGIKTDCNSIPSGTYDVDDAPHLFAVGWAFCTSGETTDCYYQIDDNSEVLLPHYNRNDVMAAFSDICTQVDCGFNYEIPLSEFSIGSHTLKLIAKCGSGTKTIASSEVIIKSSAASFKYSCDNNLKDTYEYGSTAQIHLSGWAFNPNGNETRCYYQIDNGTQTLLTPRTRNDVVAAFPGACTQTDCGYDMYITIENLSKGLHTYRVIAKCGNASQIIKETEFTIIETEGQIKCHSEHIPEGEYNLSNASYVSIQGWGYSTTAEEVKFYGKFDNGKEFYLKVEERTDVSNTQEGCYRTDCGYHQQIYLGNLGAGTHTCTVIARTAEDSKVVKTSTFTIVKPSYTVSFNANGGSGAPAQMTKTHGKNLVLPAGIPTRAYYIFKGWNTAADGSGEMIERSYKANANATLYAIWEHEEFTLNSDSPLSFDAKENLIYGEDLLKLSGDELKNSFANTNKSVSGSAVATGTEVAIYDSDGVYDTAQAVILGDVNRDSRIDGMDAVVTSSIVGGLLNKAQSGKAVFSAADCLRDGQVLESDVEKLELTGVFKDSVSQNSVASRGKFDTDFTISEAESGINLNGIPTAAQISSGSGSVSISLNTECDSFNYYGIKYSSTTYAKGTVTYRLGSENYSENFYLEPAENGEFFSFIDGVFDNVRSTELVSFSFVPLNAETFSLTVSGIGTFNREVPDTVTYIQNESIKIGLNMNWGGALSYYEDLDSDVQAVSDNGIIRIDSNAAERYSSEILNDSVNLINCHDTGRLVQQSYYGTRNYDMGFFDGHYCAYNPVQGGNMYNDSSKIVDLRAEDGEIYIKCRPLDWAKEKEYITESYMEATYYLCGDTLKTSCRFVDFSGYDPATNNQELPAFYGAATMDNFVYYGGKSPWTDDSLSTLDGLDEYLYAHYPSVAPTECWGALTGEFDDSFSIGLYVPNCKHMLAGVFDTVTAQTENPDTSNPTSYLAGGREMLFQSFDPIEYDFYITTGTVSDIRSTFKSIYES